MKFTITHSYGKDTETVFKVLTDESYLMKKFAATGAKNITIPFCAEKNSRFVITRKMDIPSNPPGFAKKFIKAMNAIEGTDTWHDYHGATKTGEFVVDIKGLPVSLGGQLTLKPSPRGCDYVIEFDVKVSIPLIGNKIAGLIENDTRANQALDYGFTKEYLETL